ncbi:hypothetical protein J0H58_26345 [bacterium]|mgnify:CR=1 FL=1|nr:hypothetical protein [bacterium]
MNPAPIQSYPTFWDAIPVEDPAPPPRPAADEAYALFADAVENTRPITLSVEQTDVG